MIRCHTQVSKADRNLVTLVVLTLRRFEYMIMGEPKIQFANFEAQLLLFGGGVMHSNSKNEHIYLPMHFF